MRKILFPTQHYEAANKITQQLLPKRNLKIPGKNDQNKYKYNRKHK